MSDKKKYFSLACLVFLAVIISGNVKGQIIVTSTADSGPGSLREAVTTANVAGGETILFTGIPNPSVIIIDNPITLTSNANLIDGDIDGDGDPDVTIRSSTGDFSGLIIQGATNTIRKLHLENFGGAFNEAIRINSATAIGNSILGCYIGTDLSGSLPGAPNEVGIEISVGASGNFIGDGTAGGRNIIAGNDNNGISIANSNDNVIQGNYIGIGADGSTSIPNLGNGIALSGSSTNNVIGGDTLSGEGNVISSNGISGVNIVADANFVYGNYIGLDATGTLAKGNNGSGILVNGDNNKIGDDIPGYGNVISANSIGISNAGGSGTLIEGNIIGLNATGTLAVGFGNLSTGIVISGTSTNVLIGNGTINGANYISGNLGGGIEVFANGVTNITINFNFIGTGTDGITPFGNVDDGILFSGNTDGNTVLNSVITGNDHGIRSTGGSNDNSISQNSIYGNDLEGLFLAGAPLPPTIDAIDGTGLLTGTGISGNSIEIFLDADDEGQIYLGSAIVDGTGNWSFPADISNFQPGLLNINATQFDGSSTSPFSSAPLSIAATFPPFVVVNTDDSGVGSLRWAIGNANADPDINTIMFNIPSSDPGYNAGTERWTIAPLTNIEDITETVIIDATTQNPFPPASTAEYRVILDGAPNALDYGLQTSAPNVEFYGFHFTGFDLNSSSAGISVTLDGAGTIIGDVNKGNIFNANSNGIYVALADNNVIKGNLVGTDYSGTISIPNNNGIHFASGSNTNIIGGPLAGEENLISGNTTSGIIFNAGGTNTVENNLIGTDITGLLSLGNGDGIRFTTSNDNTIQDNTISGNTGNGIFLSPSSNNFFYGNNIGVGTDGATSLGNNIGILGTGAPTTDVDNNTIGGTGAGEPNIIANNTNEGISITFLDMEFNTFIANQIFLNGGKGIDLGTDGNDGKTPPVITAIGTGTVSGTGIDGDIIHVYRDNTGSNPLQGAEYLGSTTVVGGVWTVLEGSIIPTDLMNATATDGANNTSEFAILFPEPEIAVFQGIDNSGIPIIDGQVAAVDFGNALIGNDIDLTFAVENTGTGNLDITNLTITGDAEFSVLTPLPPTINAGQTVNFEIRLSGAAAGTFNATITIDNSDADEAAFDFPITGTITQPEIEVFEGIDNSGIPIIDGQVAAVDFGNALIGNDIDLTFAVENTGTGILDITNLTITGDAEFSVLTPLPPTINAGQTVNFEIRLSGAAAGTFNATITIDNSDADEAAFDFPITGTITQPEIAVFQGIDNSGIPITDGQVAAVDFGSALIGNDIDLTFAVENTGTGILDITNLTITGDTEFSVLTPLPPTINVGQTVNFEIRLSGAAAGTFNATITIDNSDADEAAFDFPITGIITQPEIEVFEGIDNSGIPITDGQVAAVDFGSALIGNDIDLTFAVENTGTGILDITNLTITGDTEFSVLTPLPPTINVGQTVNFEIRLSGAAAGTFNATITIDNSDADEAAFDFPITGIITQPEIAVFQGIDNTGTPITDGQVAAIDFGSALIGNDIDLTFAVENTGTGILDITNLSITGDAEFSVLTPLPPTINVGQTVNFEIRLSGAAAGTFNATITIDNSDADEAAFDFPITGSVAQPEIAVFQGIDNSGIPIVDGQVVLVDFGIAQVGNDIDLTFAVENTGTGILDITNLTLIGDTEFSVLTPPPALINPGQTINFEIRLSGAAAGTFNAAVTIDNSDADEAVFTFPITGIISGPDIDVYLGTDNTGVPILNNQISPINFGVSFIGNDILQTFAVENNGIAILDITGITLTGTDFTVVNQPTTVAIGGTVTFQVQLSGANEGTFSDVITIQSNDPDEALFNFPITGRIVKPEIEVYKGSDNTGTNIINNTTTIEFGGALLGNDIDLTFAIENTGSSVLNISNISSDGSNFSIIGPIATPVIPGSTETFVIRLNGSVAGSFAETITISNDDPDETVFTFDVNGSITITAQPEISLFLGVDNTGVPIVASQFQNIDLGTTTADEVITQTFTIQNIGTDILTISSISITGSEFIISSAPTSIPVGGTALFEIQFSASVEGSYIQDILIQSNDTDESGFEFSVSATVLNPEINLFQGTDNTGIPIVHNVTTIEFGGVEIGGGIDLTFAIENTGSADLIITDIITGSAYSQIGVINSPIAPGSTETFVLRFEVSALGTFTEQVNIISNDPDENSILFNATGTITCCPEPEISVFLGTGNSKTPLVDNQLDEVNMGIVTAGTTVTQTFTIRNIGTLILNISNVSVGGPEFSIVNFPTSIPIGGSETFQVEFNSIDIGVFTDVVTIDNDDLNESVFNFPISATIAAPPAPEIIVYMGADNSGVLLTDEQVSVVDFGTSPKNLDLDQTFTIENQGIIDLIISSIDIDASEFSLITSTPITITPGGFENFTVGLSGQVEGIYSGNVTVVSNDLDEASFNFPIRGEILAETVGLVIKDGSTTAGTEIPDGQQEPINLGQTPRFQDIDKTFVIENTGALDIVISDISTDNIRYSIPTLPGTISPGSFDTFTVRLDASIIGTFISTVTVTSNLGDYTFAVTGEVLDLGANPPLTVYNAVTPNGDGRHDFLKIESIEAFPGNDFTLYTKAGKKIFEITDYNNSNSENRFEGYTNVNGRKLLANGIYYYIINYTFSNGVRKRISGYIILGL